MTFHKIFVGLDDSELGHKVFTQALDLAVANKAEMMLFHAVVINQFGERGTALPVDLAMNFELAEQAYQAQTVRIEKQLEQGRSLLSNYYSAAANQNIKAEYDCQTVEDAGHSICEFSQNWGADLIVLGRRGRTGLAEVMLGSVSNYVLHHTKGCVLVVQSH
ncbi:universal stress protein [Phormidium nigroviride]